MRPHGAPVWGAPRGARRGLQGAAILALFAAGCTPESSQPPRPPREEARVIVCAPGSYTAGAECLPVKPAECPTGTVMQDGQCVVPEPDPGPKEPAHVAVSDPGADYEAILDPRHRTPRSRALLVTEIQGLESLFQAMPKASPDRPRLMRRLAEGYVELGESATRDRKATADKEEASKASKIERAAHTQAAKYYQLLSTEYPLFCQTVNTADPTKSTGCTDEVIYYLALENRHLDQLDNARKSLLKLLQNYPSSRHVGPAYFIFGEMFRKEAEGDPSKWALAEQAFQESAKYPDAPTGRPALFRLAEVYEKKGDTAKAQAILAKAKRQQP